MATSINPKEIEHFAKDSAHWWDEGGPFAPLHRMNPVRLRYIRDRIARHHGLPEDGMTPFKGLNILDIGCGGGLVCEPLARLGATVTGIDADANAVEVALAHAAQNSLTIDYRNSAVEDMKGETFDVVLALEIVEHVNDVDSFVQNCVNLCKPQGIIIFSTLNRTAKSFALGIVAAEYILRWVPQGTHQWKKFIKPAELARAVRKAGARETNIKGLIYNPLEGDFKLSDYDIDVNYFMTVKK